MIVRFGGGNSGIAEYLEKGMKQGRSASRDELDQRLILEGDLEFTNRIINSIPDRGQERYLHITLSFREDEMNNELLQNVVNDYRELLMSAYAEDEYNFYAEAHLPKIKRVKDKRTGEMIDRKPHVHIVIPELNLLTLNKLSPVGLVDHHVKYLDSIQEYINQKYELATPKDYVRNTDLHHANVLARIKGDFFGKKQSELKTQLVDEIEKGKINSIVEFTDRLKEFGTIKIRNEGKQNQYYAVKIEGDKRFTNLNHPIFNENFILNKVLPFYKPDIQQITADIQEWKSRVSREIKHVNFATESFRKRYATASNNDKKQLLIDRENSYETKYRQKINLSTRRRTSDYKSNLNYIKQRREKRSFTRKTSSLSGLSYRNLVCRKIEGIRYVKSLLSKNEFINLRDRESRDNTNLRRSFSSRARSNRSNGRRIDYRSFFQVQKGTPGSKFDKNINKRSFETEFDKYLKNRKNKNKNRTQKFSQSNILEFTKKNHELEINKKIELAKFKEIRKNIDPNLFLDHLSIVYALNKKNHLITYAKDGSPRFSANKRNLNASDFLTKYLNMDWQEAKSVLLFVYNKQIDTNQQSNITRLNIQDNIKKFNNAVRQFETDINLAVHNLNIDNRNLYRLEKRRIYKRSTNQRIRNQELTIASFRAMQRQERINEIEMLATSTIKRETLSFRQTGNIKLEESYMAFKETLNIALGNEFGRIAPGDEQISFSDNFKQQQVTLQRNLKEQQVQQEKLNENDKSNTKNLFTFNSKALDEVMKLNNLGVAKKQNGDIEYKRLDDGKTLCTDVGNQMLISKEMQTPENIKTFLELAIDKYGNELKINGNNQFKEYVVETAAANNLPVILKPASLQDKLIERRKELQLEANLESFGSITNDAGMKIDKVIETKKDNSTKVETDKSVEKSAEAKVDNSTKVETDKSVEKSAEAKVDNSTKVETDKSVEKSAEAKVDNSTKVDNITDAESKAMLLASIERRATKIAEEFFKNPTLEKQMEIVDLRRNSNFDKAFQRAEEEYWRQNSSIKAEKHFDVKFKYDRQESKYNVFVNGESAKKAIEKDPVTLSVLRSHPDIMKHKVSITELQNGAINKTESMKGGNRPRDMILNSSGHRIVNDSQNQSQNNKSKGIER
ncbi:hypothetical protein H3S74_12165 [Gilliamella sp. W8126]|uniref:LPD7 domain-containing protein n=1 Tax=Gilliamella sp. W8126 TaxID=2750946 RepID=UPI0018DD1ADF|nr:LPD7 domain-containing protein [Gilliamella sp. W8126]MBI0006984.1 hypothetical protein [Gilliamella sp. W8126]